MASGAYKKAFTGLTGMAVARNPTHTLGVLYRWLLIKQNTVENNLLTESIILCSLAARICVHWLRCLQTFHTGLISCVHEYFPSNLYCHPRKHTEAVINERVSIMKNAATIEVKHWIVGKILVSGG